MKPKNKAVCISSGESGYILNYVGKQLKQEISECSELLDELGLQHDALDGISIWEGEFSYDGDPKFGEAIGKFRRPTDEEWEHIKVGRNPWTKKGGWRH